MTLQQAVKQLHKILFSQVGLLIIGLVFGFASNYLLQSYILHEDARKETRAKRQIIYLEFLDKSNSYNNSSSYAGECLNDPHNVHEDDSLEPSCNEAFNKLIADRAAFQDSLNMMSVFGSQDAVAQSERIAATLPPSLGNKAVGPGLPPIRELKEHDGSKLNGPYAKFLELSCKELPVLPRSDCKN